MTNQNTKKQEEENNGISPVVVAITGAVVGAGVAIAGAALADEKNREKVKEAFTSVKDQAMGHIEDMQKQAEETKDKVEMKVEKLGQIAKDTSEKVKKI